MAFKAKYNTIVVLIILITFFLWLFFGFGLGANLIMRARIFSLHGNKKSIAKNEFYSQYSEQDFLAGNIASVNKNGVWVWTNKGLKYFLANNNTVFLFYDVCSKVADSSHDQDLKINNKDSLVASDINEWSEWINVGNFIKLTTEEGNGGSRVFLKKVIAYELPLFLSLNLGKLCQN